MNIRKIPDLLFELYRAAQNDSVATFPETALEMLKRLLPFDMALIGLISPSADGSIRGHWGHLHNEPVSVMEEWQALSARDDVVQKMMAGVGKAVNMHPSTELAEKHKAELLDFAIRTRHMNILGMASDYTRERQIYGGLSLRRADTRNIFTAQEESTAEWLVPHFWEAIRINRTIFSTKFATAAAEPLRGFCICDQQGLIIFQDDVFEKLANLVFQQEQPFTIPARLNRLLLKNQHASFSTAEFIFNAKHIGRFCFISAFPVEKLHLLSERELQVARFYGTGLTNKEISDELQISASTVRRHIESIYTKLRIKTKADLSFLVHAASGNQTDQALRSLVEVLQS